MTTRVHYILKYSCALTICSKMKLITMRKTFKRYGKNLTIEFNKTPISYPTISHKRLQMRVKKLVENVSVVKITDFLTYRVKKPVSNLRGPCIVCICKTDIKTYQDKAFKGIYVKRGWLSVTMVNYSRNQIFVCKICYIKIHKRVNDNGRL